MRDHRTSMPRLQDQSMNRCRQGHHQLLSSGTKLRKTVDSSSAQARTLQAGGGQSGRAASQLVMWPLGVRNQAEWAAVGWAAEPAKRGQCGSSRG